MTASPTTKSTSTVKALGSFFGSVLGVLVDMEQRNRTDAMYADAIRKAVEKYSKEEYSDGTMMREVTRLVDQYEAAIHSLYNS